MIQEKSQIQHIDFLILSHDRKVMVYFGVQSLNIRPYTLALSHSKYGEPVNITFHKKKEFCSYWQDEYTKCFGPKHRNKCINSRDGPDSSFVGYPAYRISGHSQNRIPDFRPDIRWVPDTGYPAGYRIFQCLFVVRQSYLNN